MYPDLSRETARKELEPHHERFIACIREAVRKFNDIRPAATLYAIAKSKRAKANAINAIIMEEVRTEMADVPGLRVKEIHGSIEIFVGENMVVRVKKMREDGFTSNYATARVTEFHTADQGELFEICWAQPMKLDVGYIEDDLGMLAKVMVAHRRHPRSIHWTYDMTPPADVQPMPVAPAAPVTPSADETRVVARQPDNANTNTAHGTDDK